jgi:catechol 2,3-dioxygenase-like lactoylglutathione lyase family enzyme
VVTARICCVVGFFMSTQQRAPAARAPGRRLGRHGTQTVSGRPLAADVLFAGVAVRDLATATDWYGRLLGRPADIVVNHDEVMWRLADAAWLYLVVRPDRAGRSLVAVAVADLRATVTAVAAAGVAVGPVGPVGDAGLKAVATDPDGNEVALIEVHPG